MSAISPEQTYERIQPHLREAIERLARVVAAEPKTGDTSPRALLVGGFVRDLWRGEISSDADIEIYGVPAERLFFLVHELFPENVHDVGKQFGILHVPLPYHCSLDIALPRRESKLREGHKGFAIESDPFLPLTEAVRRRDFSVNALLWDPLSKELIDLVGGIRDLESKQLRVVDPLHFPEDPLRVYRAVQFAARFGYDIESHTEKQLQEMVSAGELDTLSPERITEELKKLFLQSPRPSIGLQWMCRLGIIEHCYPELQAMIDTPQEPEWHPEGDVWIHTMLCLDKAAELIAANGSFSDEERLQIFVGVLCHDLGKPPTTHEVEKNGVIRIRSLGHQEAGEAPTLSLCDKWTFNATIIHAARMIALNHLRPGELFIKSEKGELAEEAYANAVRKLLKRIFPLSWQVLLTAAEADYRGRDLPEVQTGPYLHGDRFRELIEKYHLDEEARTPLVQGRDLIELFQLKPGKQVGELLRAVENARDEGEIKTKEEAIAYVKNILSH
jgi:tRNA nucleotidyltransferase (CCA-adding enzyme)